MPELPEVESLTSQVRSNALGLKFSKIDFYRADIREKMDQKSLIEVTAHQKITNVVRRGKYMLMATSKGAVGIHLGMSGKFVIESKKSPQRKHTHVVFELKSPTQSIYYHFIDPRRFGRVFHLSKQEFENLNHPFLADLGIEPLDLSQNLATHLFDKSRTRKVPIKNFVMDSHVVVGVGNIYAAESLWRAKIDPTRSANGLSKKEFQAIAKEIKFILQRAIDAGGTTFRDYRNGNNEPGSFQTKLAVYDQEGLPCPKCKTLVVRIIQGGRSTFYCQNCQK
jgi:formamidopyrimidine-DNA glycosylase